ncbi:hypothetical protein C5167_049635 [Papaver somniferum]|uniref:eIF3a PCI domain-containing protein n=1 Tax=Papaver somniferum TaxID=3469 RepID=A0A4Y7KP44_PAPSO|nr:hypothetical protein C5167_049635 [Papaver somniferum]
MCKFAESDTGGHEFIKSTWYSLKKLVCFSLWVLVFRFGVTSYSGGEDNDVVNVICGLVGESAIGQAMNLVAPTELCQLYKIYSKVFISVGAFCFVDISNSSTVTDLVNKELHGLTGNFSFFTEEYRIVCQQVNVGSLEEVIKHILHLSTKKTDNEKIQAEALEEALDVDDLEDDKRHGDFMLSYVGGEEGKDRSDHVLVTPWFKFLWET